MSKGSSLLMLLVVAASISSDGLAMGQPLTVTHFVGVDRPTGADGPSLEAGFADPAGVAAGPSGALYVVENVTRTVRKATPDGAVVTLAGLAGVSGLDDGKGSAARFMNPIAIAVDASENVLVADEDAGAIRKVGPNGDVTRVAGGIHAPSGLAVDRSGTIFVFANGALLRMTSAGSVTTLAGADGTRGSADGIGSEARFGPPEDLYISPGKPPVLIPTGLAVDGAGNVFLADTSNCTIRKITPSGAVSTIAGAPGQYGSTDGTGTAARFIYPTGVAVGPNGSLFVADWGNSLLRRITADGNVTTIGRTCGTCGSSTGGHDGTTEATFNFPTGIATGQNGYVYVADRALSWNGERVLGANGTIRKIEVVDPPIVSTISGRSANLPTFLGPWGITVDPSGNVYVADNGTVRKITPEGAVTTLAGLASVNGHVDGKGSQARFNNGPFKLVADAEGNLYVCDWFNVNSDFEGGSIRKVGPDGTVTTVAGAGAIGCYADGTWTSTNFDAPTGIAIDSQGAIYVSDVDSSCQSVKKLSPDGTVRTIARGFSYPTGLSVDAHGNVYVSDTNNDMIRMITPDGAVVDVAGANHQTGWDDGPGANARFIHPFDVAVDGAGNVFVADQLNNSIRKISPAGIVSTLAGGDYNNHGTRDGSGRDARFYHPNALALDRAGNLFVADGAATIRKVTPQGDVTTFAGVPGSAGSTDGPPLSPLLVFASGNLAADRQGNLFTTAGTAVVKIAPEGTITTLAGALFGDPGGTGDGVGGAATFTRPGAVAVGVDGSVYVADNGNPRVRRVSALGAVTTVAGSPNGQGSSDGTGSAATFTEISGMAVDAAGNVIVADGGTTVRRVTPTGAVTTLAGVARQYGTADGTGSAARFSGLGAIALDGAGNAVVMDYGRSLRRITPGGVVTTLLTYPSTPRCDGLAFDAAGNLWCSTNDTVVRIAANGASTTAAGLDGTPGNDDGTGSAARFSRPAGLAFGPDGRLFIADIGNTAIRVATAAPPLPDTATIDLAKGALGQVRQLDAVPRTGTRWEWSVVRQPIGSGAALSSTTIPNPTFVPDVADLYVFRLVVTGPAGASVSTVSLTGYVPPPQPPTVNRLVPIALDVTSGTAHYATELVLTNNTPARLALSVLYTPSLGSRAGGGTVTDELAPGEQRIVPDALAYLRGKGLAIPPAPSEPSQGGTILVNFQSQSPLDARLVSVTARTTTRTVAPQPTGQAGLAYSSLLSSDGMTSSATIFGLRSSPADRSNVAVFSTSDAPVIFRVTVASGSGDGKTVVFREGDTLPPWGWLQYSSGSLLDANGISQGWVTIERTSSQGSFSAYGVINDAITNDGSFVPPAQTGSGNGLTVPVLVETSSFRSELTLANKGVTPITLTLKYVESISPQAGSGGTLNVVLGPKEQRIIPDAVDYLRRSGVAIGTRGDLPYGGALRIAVTGGAVTDMFAGARTAASSPAGGEFGVFTPGVYSGQEASSEAYLYGLRADPENRTNVAVLHTGADGSGPIALELQAFDGAKGGAAAGSPATVTLGPGQWSQLGNFLKAAGVSDGWVRVTRTEGSAPWVAYAIVNDGGMPDQRTGDGAYVPMVK